MPIPGDSRRFARPDYIIIVLLAAILCAPCLFVGMPSGHNSETHAMYQYHFSRQFWSGDFYPRWLTGANKGYGSPIFLAQYPLPYFVTALLRPVMAFPMSPTREARELGVFLFLVLAAAGVAARLWFSDLCNRYAATAAAALYMMLPFIFGQSLYTRSSLGELAAFIWMPLALYLCSSIEWTPATISCLAIVIGLLIVSHVLTAALFMPLMIGYAVASRPRDPAAKVLTAVFAATALAVGIVAIYVFPLFVFRDLIQVTAMRRTCPTYELGRGFIFLASNVRVTRWVAVALAVSLALAFIVLRFVWRNTPRLFGRASIALVVLLGALLTIPGLGGRIVQLSGLDVSSADTPMMYTHSLRNFITGLLTLAVGLLGYARIARKEDDLRGKLLATAACVSFLLMLPWTAPVWRAIPQLALFQYPNRLGTILTVAAAGLFAIGLGDCLQNSAQLQARPTLVEMSLVAFTVIIAGALTWGVTKRVLHPSTVSLDAAQEVDLMYRAYVPYDRLPRFAAMVGTSPAVFDVSSTPVQNDIVGEFVSGRGTVVVKPVTPRQLNVSLLAGERSRVRISQLYSPLWKAFPATAPCSMPLESSEEGLIELSCDAGPHDFQLIFDGGSPERWGRRVSLVSLLLAAAGLVLGGFLKKQ